MIEILNFRRFDKGYLIGSVNVKVPKWGGFIINKIKIFGKNGHRWINFPEEPYEENGAKKYFKLNNFEDPEMKKKFEKVLFFELDKWIEKNKSSEKNDEKIDF